VIPGNPDKSWASNIVYKSFAEYLLQRTNYTGKILRIAPSLVWCEPKKHLSNYCFCEMTTKGIIRKNKISLRYVT